MYTQHNFLFVLIFLRLFAFAYQLNWGQRSLCGQRILCGQYNLDKPDKCVKKVIANVNWPRNKGGEWREIMIMESKHTHRGHNNFPQWPFERTIKQISSSERRKGREHSLQRMLSEYKSFSEMICFEVIFVGMSKQAQSATSCNLDCERIALAHIQRVQPHNRFGCAAALVSVGAVNVRLDTHKFSWIKWTIASRNTTEITIDAIRVRQCTRYVSRCAPSRLSDYVCVRGKRLHLPGPAIVLLVPSTKW